MSSLRDQLLKAGLVTKEQVKKAETKPQLKRRSKNTNHKINSSQKKQIRKPKPKRELSDLEQFYHQRSSVENKERQQEKKAKEELAQLKKERNLKISRLVNENMLAIDDPSERYNFVIGTAVKYIYVSAAQLDELADGKLALTFLKGKCRVISSDMAKEIREIDPRRLIVQQQLEQKNK